MFKKILSLLMLCLLLNGVVAEANDIHFSENSDDQHMITTDHDVNKIILSIRNEHCTEKHDSDSHHPNCHCNHHCFELNQFVVTKHMFNLQEFSFKAGMMGNYYYHAYKSPFIDPALRPPLFS